MPSDGDNQRPVAGRNQRGLPRDFRLLRAGAWISNLGDGVRMAALPLLAVSFTTNPATIGALAATSTLPFVFLGPLTGTLADRRRRGPLVAGAHLFRAVAVAVLAIGMLTDAATLAWVFVTAAMLGLGEAVADAAAPAMVPDLVHDHELERAISDISQAELAGNDLLGPAAGGWLFALGRSVPFVVDAASFLVAALLVRRIDDPPLPERPPTSVRSDLRDGWRAIRHEPVLRSTILTVTGLNFGLILGTTTLVLYLSVGFGLSPIGYGAFLSITAVGGMLGARIAPYVRARATTPTALIIAVLGSITGLLLMVVDHLAVVLLGDTIALGSLYLGRVVIVAARQRATPAELQGRVQGFTRTALWAASTAGAIAGGLVAHRFGFRAPFVWAATIYGVVLVTVVPSMRRAFGQDRSGIVGHN